MKLGIKRKMILSFIIVILIPTLLTLTLLFMNVYNHISDSHIIDNNEFQSKNLTFTTTNIFIFGLGFITLIALILLSSLYISKSVLLPLKELNKSTENIANGNLDYHINYNNDNELGRFCKTFDSMRIKLKESLEKQARDENSRKEMIASISHDLRTPLSSIKGYVEGLQDGIVESKEDVDNYLSIIKNKTDKLDRLIDDLFQFSRLELDKLEMYIKEENICEVFKDILNNMVLELQQYHVNLLIEKPFPSIIINIDRYRISQVLDNLIMNAFNYSNNDTEIKLGANIKDTYLEIYVEDNGIGINTEDLPHVFERFYRGDKSRSREYGGTGLGLAICKYIIEAHGGEIWVTSIKNKGSIFYFSLPLISKDIYKKAIND